RVRTRAEPSQPTPAGLADATRPSTGGRSERRPRTRTDLLLEVGPGRLPGPAMPPGLGSGIDALRRRTPASEPCFRTPASRRNPRPPGGHEPWPSGRAPPGRREAADTRGSRTSPTSRGGRALERSSPSCPEEAGTVDREALAVRSPERASTAPPARPVRDRLHPRSAGRTARAGPRSFRYPERL